MTRTRKVGASKFGGTGSGPGYKGYRLGTHRAVSPTETIAQVAPFLAGMGITRVANVTGLDRIGIPIVMVVRPNSRSLAVSQGKGLDLDSRRRSRSSTRQHRSVPRKSPQKNRCHCVPA